MTRVGKIMLTGYRSVVRILGIPIVPSKRGVVVVNRERVQVFLQGVYKILVAPDSRHRLEVEPVYEAGQLGLHVFYPLFSTGNDLIEEIDAATDVWNRKFPLVYMTRSAVADCHTEQGYSNGFVHIPLAPAEALLRIDYKRTSLCSAVLRDAQRGMYRNEFHRKRVTRILQIDNRLGINERQFRHFVMLSNLLAGLHLSPNYFRRSRSVVPVYENHSCGLHVYHRDRRVLEVLNMVWLIRNPVAWGGKERGCTGTKNCLHFGLGEHSAYLINTQVFAKLLRHRR